MRIFEIMSDDVLTVAPAIAASEAWRMMSEHNVRHLVVKDGSHVVGILSDGDAGGPHGAAVRTDATAGDLMNRHFATVTPQDTVRKAANLMRGRLTGCLPVVERGRLVGVVTVGSMLALLGHGVERPSHEARAALHHRTPHRKTASGAGRW